MTLQLNVGISNLRSLQVLPAEECESGPDGDESLLLARTFETLGINLIVQLTTIRQFQFFLDVLQVLSVGIQVLTDCIPDNVSPQINVNNSWVFPYFFMFKRVQNIFPHISRFGYVMHRASK